MIYERTWFNKRNHLPNESVEQFITEVHRLGDSSEFGEMKEEQIRDHLVLGICDHSLSEQLQMEPDVTLDKAKRLIHQRDAVKEQQETLKAPIKEENVLDAISRRTPRRILPKIPVTPPPPTPLQSCRRCGKGSHPA